MSDIPNVPLPDFEQVRQYGIVGFLFWLLGKFGQRLLDFVLERLGLNSDRRSSEGDNLKKQVEDLRTQVQKLTVKVGVLEGHKDVVSELGVAFKRRLAELGIQDTSLNFLVDTLVKFSQDGEEDDDE